MAKINIPADPELAQTTIQEKVYNLYVELVQAEKDKKEAAKMHSENIKRIKEEIKAVLDEAVDDVVAAQRDAE